MSTIEQDLRVRPDEEQIDVSSRRSFLQRAAVTGAIGASGLGAILSIGSPAKGATGADHDDDEDASKNATPTS